jgi:hypothetical protein
LRINFSQFGDGRYKVKYDSNWYPNEILGGFNPFGSSPNYICIDTTPPSFSVFVNKTPDGKWAILKDKGIMVHWYDTDPETRPVVYFLPSEKLKPSDTSSGIFTGSFSYDI